MASARSKAGSSVRVSIHSEVYPLEAVYGAAYGFLDRAYILLDKDRKGNVVVTLQPKEKGSHARDLKNEFLNALLGYSIRVQVSQNNQKLREYILGRALIGALPEEEERTQETPEWTGDDLGIAVPWEKKFGNKVSHPKKRRSA